MTATTAGLVRLDGVRASDMTSGTLHVAVLRDGTRLCVGRHEASFFAVQDRCTHSEFPLSEGTLYPTGEIECCFHGARFDCRSGAVLRGPAEEPLVRYDVTERDGTLWVRAPEAS